MGSYNAPPFSGGTVTSLASSGAVSGTTGTFTGALAGASVAATAAVTGASVTATGQVQGATVKATSGFGAWGTTPPAAQPGAYTLNGTVTRTLAAATAVAPASTAATNVTPYGFTTAAQADAVRAGVSALITDVANIRGVLRQLLADLQSYGITA